MLKSHFKIAWRNITRNKIYTLINILGLTLGICACLVIFLIIRHELSYDTFHQDKQYIYRITDRIQHGDDKRTEIAVPPVLPLAARGTVSGFDAIAAYHKISDSTIITEPQYFTIFKYDWLAGNPATALSTPFSVVISENSARKHFGSMSPGMIMGKELVYKDSLRVTVTGVIKDWEGNTDFPFTDFISFSTIDASFLKQEIRLEWGNANVPWTSRALIKLKKEASPARIETQLASLVKGRIHLEPGEKVSFALQPLSDIHFNNNVQDGAPKAHAATQYILAGIAVFILLLAVINFINLSTALAIRRAKEVGIRKVLGSSSRRLTLQFLIETGMLTLFSLLLALLLVTPALHLFHEMIPNGLHFHIFSPDVLIFLVLIVLVTTLLSGLYPAKVLASWLPVLCLKGGVQKGGEKWWLRKGLIVFQFTISLLFIISTLIIQRQINYMRNEDLGFSTDAIITMETDRGDTTGRQKVLAQRLRQLPGINMITLQSFSPITGFHTMIPLQYKGRQIQNVSSALQIADEHFIPLYSIKLLAGRGLRHTDSLQEFVINESMLKAMGLPHPLDAIGRTLSLGDRNIPITGVVADFHEYSYHDAILPIVMADLSVAETSIAVKLATNGRHINNLQNTLTGIERQWKNIYPGIPFHYTFLDEDIAMMYEKEKETAFLVNIAMIITVLISCMGLLGLSIFSARQRTKEIGIRKVLGASATHIVILLSRNLAVLVVIAILIASPLAWYCMHLWLQNFVYRADITVWIFVASGLVALGIALLTISFQTIRTALINPADTLRTE